MTYKKNAIKYDISNKKGTQTQTKAIEYESLMHGKIN